MHGVSGEVCWGVGVGKERCVGRGVGRGVESVLGEWGSVLVCGGR